MSLETAHANPNAPSAAAVAGRNAALRIAFGAVIGFLLAGAFQITLFFLPALLAVQLLSLMVRPPVLAEAIALVFLMAVLAWVTLLVAGVFSGQPVVYLLMVGLLVFFGFLLDSAGKAIPATLMLTLGSTIPLVVAQSADAAAGIAGALIGATVIALLAIWTVFALFPAASSATAVAPASHASPRAALINTALLIPVLLLFLIDGRMTFVAVIVIVNIIRQRKRGAASLAALGLLFGNILGGVLASIAYAFVTVQSGPVFFLLVVLLFGLMLGGGGVVAGPKAPIYSVAFVSFIILLGLGISPAPGETAVYFVDRLVSVLGAGAYAVGAISLVSRGDTAPEAPESNYDQRLNAG